jgi:signal transduction histidine kinase
MEFSYHLLIIFALIPFIILAASIYVVESAYQNIEENEIKQVKNLIKIQKEKVVSDFDYLIDSVEAYPKLPEWKILLNEDKIIEEQGGISENDEKAKREGAKFLISNFGFQSFGITLTDGRMYLLEPFEHQFNLSKMNFSDREWFQGVERTKSTFVSDVFVSAASNHPIIVISTPIFSNNENMIGMWGGSLDLEYLTGFLNQVKMENSSVLLMDEKNIIIADTEDVDFHDIILDKTIIEITSQAEDLDYLKNDEGHFFINEIKIGNKNWKMITKISNEKLLPQVDSGIRENYIFIGLMVVFIIIAELLLISLFKKNFQLTMNIKENQKILIKQERLAAIGELASRVAHDIRNPLSNIGMSIKLIEDKSPDTKISDESIKEKLQIASKNIERISHQVNNVLDYVRDRRITRKEISLHSCLDETIELLQIPKHIKIKSDGPDLKILADPIQLQIVCNNILINAIQAIGKNSGEIKITFSEDDNNVKIEIENSGASIPQEVLPHVFESLITTKQSGTGLGLASCKRIIENHGGEISVKNNPTTFTIKLPKSQVKSKNFDS